MELRNLRALVEVARQGGFTKAAQVLFSTQSTVSKAVRQLEDELGEELFTRLSDGVRLTEAGELVYARAVVMLAEAEHVQSELAELRGRYTGRLRLGLPIFGSARLFAPLFTEFRSRYPGIDIELLEQGSGHLETAILAGELELAVSLLPVADSFQWQAVCDHPLMALLWKDHPLHKHRSIKLKDLEPSPFILFEQGFVLNHLIEDACKRRGFTPQVSARSSQMDFIVALAAAELGVPLLPRVMVEGRRFTSLKSVLVDEPDLRWKAALVWRKEARLSPAAKAWLDLTQEFFPVGDAGETQ